MLVAKLLKNAKLEVAPGKEPPAEFLIFAFGDYETTKGTLKFDEEGAAEVLSRWSEKGHDLGGDYEHASLYDPPPAGGAPSPLWCKLEVRADGLWAVSVTWTPRATEYLKNGEYRYFSPALYSDDDDRIVELVNIALTNLPATKNQEPLVAAKDTNLVKATDRRSKLVALSMSFDQVREALDLALKGKYPDGYAWVCDVYDDSVVFAMGRKLFQAPYALDGNTAAIGEVTEVQRTYTPVATGAGEEEITMKGLLKTLKLSDTATEAEALIALAQMQRELQDAQKLTTDTDAQLLALTETKSRSEAIGTISAWKVAHGQVVKLTADLAAVNAANQTKETEQLVDAGVRDGKITPATKDFWLEQGKKDVLVLKAFLEKAPVVVTKTTEARKPGDDAELVTLSDDEKKIAKNMQLSEKDYLEGKKRALAKQRGESASA